MRYFFILLFLTSSVFAQENCNFEVSRKAKKLYKGCLAKLKKGKDVFAVKNLKKAIELQEDYVDAYILLAQLCVDEENFSATEKYYEKVISICPMHSAEIYWFLANANMQKNDFEKSAEYFQAYLRFLGISEDDRGLALKRLDKSKFLDDIYSNPVPFSPKPVRGVSTKDDEYLAILSPDNEFAFFTRRKEKQEIGMLRSETVEEFLVSELVDGKFVDAKLMPYPFNYRDNEGGASLSIRNDELFITVCETQAGYNNCDIYYSYMDRGVWAELEKLKYPVNKSDSWESQPSISSDGKTLIFCSNRAEVGTANSNLYSVSRQEDGKWGNIKSLSVNTLGNEKSPFLHPDNKTLYFSSDTHLGLGGLDIFYVKKDSLGQFGEPVNIGYPINGQNDDLGFFVGTGGKTAFFSSNNLDGIGGWDLYSFDLHKNARPEKVLFLKGKVLDQDGEPLVDAVVEIKPLSSGEVSVVEVDRDGKYVGVVSLAQDEDVLISVKNEGSAFNSSYVSSNDDMFNSSAKLDFKMEEIAANKAFKINNIYFPTDSFSLSIQSKNILNSFIEFLHINSNVHLAVHGHTDDSGIYSLNVALSEKRAKAVRDYLVSQGIDSKRVSFKGFGSKFPIYSNDTEEGRSSNRRTEFYVTQK